MPTVVRGVEDLRSAAAALQTVDAKVRTEARRYVAAGLPHIWNKSEIESHPVQTNAQKEMLAVRSAKAKARTGGITFEATSVAESRDLVYQWWEFGTHKQNAYNDYSTRSRKGKRYNVRRRTRRQLPGFIKSGRRYWPAVADAAPRALSLYTQTVIRTIAEALEGKS